VSIDHVYCLRAECLADVQQLVNKALWTSFTVHAITLINGAKIPDVVLELTSSESIEQLRDKIGQVLDGHVMLETIALKKDYTGERSYAVYAKGDPGI